MEYINKLLTSEYKKLIKFNEAKIAELEKIGNSLNWKITNMRKVDEKEPLERFNNKFIWEQIFQLKEATAVLKTELAAMEEQND